MPATGSSTSSSRTSVSARALGEPLAGPRRLRSRNRRPRRPPSPSSSSSPVVAVAGRRLSLRFWLPPGALRFSDSGLVVAGLAARFWLPSRLAVAGRRLVAVLITAGAPDPGCRPRCGRRLIRGRSPVRSVAARSGRPVVAIAAVAAVRRSVRWPYCAVLAAALRPGRPRTSVAGPSRRAARRRYGAVSRRSARRLPALLGAHGCAHADVGGGAPGRLGGGRARPAGAPLAGGPGQLGGRSAGLVRRLPLRWPFGAGAGGLPAPPLAAPQWEPRRRTACAEMAATRSPLRIPEVPLMPSCPASDLEVGEHHAREARRAVRRRVRVGGGVEQLRGFAHEDPSCPATIPTRVECRRRDARRRARSAPWRARTDVARHRGRSPMDSAVTRVCSGRCPQIDCGR